MKRKTKIIINSILVILIFILLGSVWLYMPKYDEKGIFIQNQPQNATTSQLDTSKRVVEIDDKTTFTAYNLSVAQTDDSPCIGAGNNNLCELKPILKEQNKIICASRDLPLDTEIYIDGYGICVIKDRLNIRYKGTNRIDILMDTYEEAINFGVRELSYIIVK